MQLYNLTGHDCSFFNGTTIPKHGMVRLGYSELMVGEIDGVPIYDIKYESSSTILPAFSEGKYYIVSQLICQAYPNREDLYIPIGNKNQKASGLIQNPFYKITINANVN